MKRLLKTFALFSLILPLLATLLVASCSDIDGGGHKHKKKKSVLTISIGEEDTKYTKNLARAGRTVEPLQENQELNDFINLKLTYKDEGGILHCVGASSSDNVIEWDTVTALNTEKKTLVIPVSAFYDFTLTCFRYGTPFFQTIKKQVTVGEPIALSFNALTVDEEKIKRAATSSTPSTPPSTPPGANSSLLGVNSRADTEEETAENAQYKAGVTVSPKALLYLEVNYPPEKAIKKVEVTLEDEDNSSVDNKISLEKVATLEAGATGITDNTTYSGSNTQEAGKTFDLDSCYIIKDSNGNITHAVLSLYLPSSLPLVTFLAYDNESGNFTNNTLITAERATLINGYKSRKATSPVLVDINREHRDLLAIYYYQNTTNTDPKMEIKDYYVGAYAVLSAESLGFTNGVKVFKCWSTSATDDGGLNTPAGATRFYPGDTPDFAAQKTALDVVNLYAVWISDIEITYNSNSDTDPTATIVKTVKLNKETCKFETPTSLEYSNGDKVFCGWDTEEEGLGTRYKEDGIYTGKTNLILYATWCTRDITNLYIVNTNKDYYAAMGHLANQTNITTAIKLNASLSGINTKQSKDKTLLVSFEGNGKTLSTIGNGALFSNLGNSSNKRYKISNLTLSSAVTASAHSLLLDDTNYGTVENCIINGSLSTTSSDAGLVCKVNAGTINNVTVNAVISSAVGLVGGVAGTNSSSITNCTVDGAITSNSASYVGGVAGTNSSSITNCTVTGAITATSSTGVGGVAGRNLNGSTIKCSKYIKTSSTIQGHINAGGVVGVNEGNCLYNTFGASITGNASNSCVGGIAGLNNYNNSSTYGKVKYCISWGTVTALLGGGSSAGGIIGKADCSEKQTTCIDVCVAAGTVGGSSYLGGLIGYNYRARSRSCYTVINEGATGNVVNCPCSYDHDKTRKCIGGLYGYENHKDEGDGSPFGAVKTLTYDACTGWEYSFVGYNNVSSKFSECSMGFRHGSGAGDYRIDDIDDKIKQINDNAPGGSPTLIKKSDLSTGKTAGGAENTSPQIPYIIQWP